MLERLIQERCVPPIFQEGMAWEARRATILNWFAHQVYGVSPQPAPVTGKLLTRQERDLAGKACHDRIALTLSTPRGGFTFPIDLLWPTQAQPRTLLLHISFKPEVPNNYFAAEEIIDHGFAACQMCYQDVTSDDADMNNGLAGCYDRPGGEGWGKIAMWAWAASRVIDYLTTLPQMRGVELGVLGHSRLGKTALWCGANDARVNFTYANDSGCSGVALSRGKGGESIARITEVFPYWFCENYRAYADKEAETAWDQDALVACVAPRVFYAASAANDAWADPVSEYLSLVSASAAWERQGAKGLAASSALPKVGDAFHAGTVGYHLRAGDHYFSREDWNQFMAYLKGREAAARV